MSMKEYNAGVKMVQDLLAAGVDQEALVAAFVYGGETNSFWNGFFSELAYIILS